MSDPRLCTCCGKRMRNPDALRCAHCRYGSCPRCHHENGSKRAHAHRGTATEERLVALAALAAAHLPLFVARRVSR